MLLDRATKPINPGSIKAVRKQIDEIVSRADGYRDSEMYNSCIFSTGLGDDWVVFTMDIEPTTDEDIDTFEFETRREPDKRFLNHTKSLFDMSKEESEIGKFWKISMSKKQFSNSKLLNELLSWLFEDWEDIELFFDSEDDLEWFEESFEVLIPYRFPDIEQEDEPTSKSGVKKAAATATGFFVAYKTEEVSYADNDDSDFDFPEF
jgi:hypothetical protein